MEKATGSNDLAEEEIKLLKQVVNKYMGFGIDVEDLMQEGIVGLLEAKKRVITAKPENYYYACIKYKILQALKKNRPQAIRYVPLDDENIEGTSFPQEEEPVSRCIDSDLPKTISDIERKILKLDFEEKKTIKEIAEACSIAKRRVKQLKQRALRKIKIQGCYNNNKNH